MKKLNLVCMLALVAMLLMVTATPALAEAVQEEPAPFMIDLTNIIQVVIALVVTLVSSRLIPWLKARTTSDQQAALNIAARTLVFAAEQMYKGDKQGAQRLRYVVDGLRKKGFNVDFDAIEAAVMELKQGEAAAVEIEQAVELFDVDGFRDNPDSQE